MSKWREKEYLIFILLILLHLIPIWSFKYFPSQDGPVHLENAHIIRQYHHPQHSILRQFYSFHKKLLPFWLDHLLLAGLMYLVPALIAEKILLSGYIILLPLSARYALRSINPSSGFLAFMAFPFLYNLMFNKGFYGFSLSLPFFFLILGFWSKYRDRLKPGKVLTLCLLFLLIYSSHLVSLIIVLVGIAFLTALQTAFSSIQEFRAKKFSLYSLCKSLRKKALPLFLAALPALILALGFLSRLLSREGGTAVTKYSIGPLVKRFFTLYALVSHDKNEVILSGAMVCLFVIVSGYILLSKLLHRRLILGDELLLLALVYILVYALSPETVGLGGSISTRISIFPFFALILWFGAQALPQIIKLKIKIGAIVICLFFLGIRTFQYAELNGYLEEYLSGIHLIEEETTFLPLSFAHQGISSEGRILSSKTKPFLHASGHIAIQRNIIDFANYQASGSSIFPILFRSSLDPYLHIGQIEGEPPRVEFLTYAQRTGQPLDYVLLWGIREDVGNTVEAKSIFKQLKGGYTLIFISPQRGLLRLYRRQDF